MPKNKHAGCIKVNRWIDLSTISLPIHGFLSLYGQLKELDSSLLQQQEGGKKEQQGNPNTDIHGGYTRSVITSLHLLKRNLFGWTDFQKTPPRIRAEVCCVI